MKTNTDALFEVLRDALQSLSRPGNNFAASHWKNLRQATEEFEPLFMRLDAEELPNRSELAMLFAPTGPIHRVSVSSGWADEYQSLADRFDAAMRSAFPPERYVLPASFGPTNTLNYARGVGVQGERRSLRLTLIILYGHFAAAYGTCWLVMLGLALVAQTSVNAGVFGLLGFPAVSIVYAFVRLGMRAADRVD